MLEKWTSNKERNVTYSCIWKRQCILMELVEAVSISMTNHLTCVHWETGLEQICMKGAEVSEYIAAAVVTVCWSDKAVCTLHYKQLMLMSTLVILILITTKAYRSCWVESNTIEHKLSLESWHNWVHWFKHSKLCYQQ